MHSQVARVVHTHLSINQLQHRPCAAHYFQIVFSFVFLLDGHFMIPLYPGAHNITLHHNQLRCHWNLLFYSFLFVFLFIVPILEHFFTSQVIHLSPTVRSCTLLYSVSTHVSRIREYPHALNPKTKHVLLKTMSVTTCILTSSITSGILQLMHWSRCLQFFTR